MTVISDVYAMDNEMFGDRSHVYKGAVDTTNYIYAHIGDDDDITILSSGLN